jgi:hypothetical protein
MKQRCTNPKYRSYPDYGARGIRVCKRWSRFENFIADMGRKPSPFHQIERKNNNLGYSPDNCRWATREEQMHNKRDNINITIGSETKCVWEWSRKFGINPWTLRSRIKAGWNSVYAVVTPARHKRKSIS